MKVRVCDPFSKYEPADISYCLKHTFNPHNQIDMHRQTELWELCCVIIAWKSVSMDSCIPFASAYLIPPSLPCIQTLSPPLFTVSLYIWHYMEFGKKHLICCTEPENSHFSFFSFSLTTQPSFTMLTWWKISLWEWEAKMLQWCFTAEFQVWKANKIVTV